MKTFKTEKGTELPISEILGKDYLEVKYRLVWFREEHPLWGIETEILSFDKTMALSKATIKDENGRILTQSVKMETPQGFPDFIEKSETGAIGRALALLGYGTQFAPEVEEGERIVDSPAERPIKAPERAKVESKPSKQAKDHKEATAPLHAPAMKNFAPTAKQDVIPEDAPWPKEMPPEEPLFPEEDLGAKDHSGYVINFGKFKGKEFRELGRAELMNYVKYLRESAERDHKPLSLMVANMVHAAEEYVRS
jgi:hypothetical protein